MEYNFAGFNLARDLVHQTAVEKGWWEPQEQTVALPLQGGPVKAMVPRSFGDLIALVHSEASEALEDYRAGHHPRELSYKYTSLPGKGSGYALRNDRGIWVDGVRLTPDNAAELGYEAKPEGIPAELADIIIRVLDIAGYYGIDIEHAMLVKARYNEGREHRHGGKVM